MIIYKHKKMNDFINVVSYYRHSNEYKYLLYSKDLNVYFCSNKNDLSFELIHQKPLYNGK